MCIDGWVLIICLCVVWMQVQRLEAELAGRTPGSGVTVELLTQALEYRYAHTPT
jgi:hypothetical protein